MLTTEDMLIKNNIGLIIKMAKRFNPNNFDTLDEYIQLAMIGFMYAIRIHDPKKGKLQTIAWFCIKRQILNHLRKEQKHLQTQTSANLYNQFYLPQAEWVDEVLPDTLTDTEQNIMRLRFEQGCTFAEIDSKLGQPERWSNYRYHKALAKIAECLREDQ